MSIEPKLVFIIYVIAILLVDERTKLDYIVIVTSLYQKCNILVSYVLFLSVSNFLAHMFCY